MKNSHESSVAVPMIVTYWLTATVVSLVAMLIDDPLSDTAGLAFAPLLPLLPLLTFVAFGLSPTGNPLPIGLVLSAFVYPTLFVFLAKITRRFAIPPVVVGLLCGFVNGILAAACIRAMTQSL